MVKAQAPPVNWAAVKNEMVASGFAKATKQCRERWLHYLNPDLSKAKWTEREDELLFDHTFRIGCQWKQISEQMAGRSYNLVKNRFFAIVRKGLRKACKSAHLGDNTKIIGELKPKTICEFFFMTVPFQKGEAYAFPFESPLRVKDFLLHLSRLKHSEIGSKATALPVNLVENCLEILHKIKLIYQLQKYEEETTVFQAQINKGRPLRSAVTQRLRNKKVSKSGCAPTLRDADRRARR